MSLNLIVLPILAFVGTALLIPCLRPWLDSHAYRVLLLAGGVVAFLLSLALVQQSGAETMAETVSVWSDLAGTGGVRLQVDTMGASVLLLTGLVGMATLVGSLDGQEAVASNTYQAGLLAMLGGVAALGLAGNLLTMLLATVLIDLSLIYAIGLAGRPRWLLVTIFHALAAQGAALAAMLLLWRGSGGSALVAAPPSVVWLLLLAGVLRMAPLPLSLLPVAFESLPRRVLALMPLATLGVGSVWLGRMAQPLPIDALAPLEPLAAVAALGVALGGWVAWRRDGQTGRLMMLGAVQAAWVLWAFVWGQPGMALAVAWGGVPALATLALHGGRVDFRHGAQLPGLVAALMLVGFPGSALWNAATLLGGEAWQRGASGSLALGVIGTMGVTVTLVHWLLPDETEPYERSRWTGILLLAALSVPFIALMWGIEVPDLPAVEGARGPLAAQVVMMIAGWSGGVLLWRNREQFQPLSPLLDNVAELFSFAWFWRLLGRLGWLLLSGVRGMMLVVEGENYGWLLLFLFLTLVFLLPQ